MKKIQHTVPATECRACLKEWRFRAAATGRIVDASELTTQISPAENPSTADRAFRMVVAALALSGTDKYEAFNAASGAVRS